jgi:hypothetical protein
MGGNKNWRGLLIDLCLNDHDRLHDKQWYLEVTIEGYDREGELLFSRKLEDLEDA